MSVSGDKLWVMLSAVSHICIQWSMILEPVFSCEEMKASTDLSETASAFMLVK